MNKTLRYFISFGIVILVTHFLILPGLESNNEIVKTSTLILFIFTVIWALFIFPKNK